MASTTNKQTCAKCSKGGGIAMCNGCQQSFCIKHFIEHRQELSQYMENIGQEHDLLRRDLNSEQNIQPLLTRIDQWEEETIEKIHAYAKQIRVDLQQLFAQTRNELNTSVHRLTEELRTCREADDYTEMDINKWNEQLKGLRQMIENPSNIVVEYENNSTSIIPLIKVSNKQRLSRTNNQERRLNAIDHRTIEQHVTLSSEKFAECYGNITISPDGLTANGTGTRWDGSCISGIGRYSSKVHHIRFRIQNKISNFLFFGIITGSQKLTGDVFVSKSLNGWWELGFNVVNGTPKDGDQRKTLASGDEVTLILDCDNRQIRLHHHRTNTLVDLDVHIEHCPFPWKIILRLDSSQDCVKILH